MFDVSRKHASRGWRGIAGLERVPEHFAACLRGDPADCIGADDVVGSFGGLAPSSG